MSRLSRNQASERPGSSRNNHQDVFVRLLLALATKQRLSLISSDSLGRFWPGALSEAYPGTTAVLLDELHAGSFYLCPRPSPATLHST